MLKGARSVSPDTTRTSSKPTPNSSATTWVKVVSWLWPWGCWLVNTVAVPSGSSFTRARCIERCS